MKGKTDMTIQEEIHAMGVKARAAAGALRAFTTEQKNAALRALGLKTVPRPKNPRR